MKDKIINYLRSWSFWRTVLAILIGGALGFAYYYFVGCKSGQCPITGSPLGSTVMGALFGLFVTSSPCSKNQC
jgi:hypothetical protein